MFSNHNIQPQVKKKKQNNDNNNNVEKGLDG